MTSFTVYPAIDLRQGKVVRLAEGDPDRQKVYGDDPAATARRWLSAGAAWLHVVNLDGAFGKADRDNQMVLNAILATRDNSYPLSHIQFGGGIRSIETIRMVFTAGVDRVVLGTVAVENPQLVSAALREFGQERVAVAIDARDGKVRLRGWKKSSEIKANDLAVTLAQSGLRTAIFTNVARDGMGTGVDIPSTLALAQASGLDVIASGGINSIDDIRQVREAGLAGVIVGRALYEDKFSIQEALAC